MEGLPHWPLVLRAYAKPGSRVSCEHVGNETGVAAGSGYKCRGIYLGNTIFAPVLGSVRLHVLRQLHDIRRCLHLMGSREQAAGKAYDRVVHSRLEYVWLRPHPPLPMLTRHAVWVPSGEDYYGGINDRHAVLSRAAAEVYMRRWDLITDGSVLKIEPQLRSGGVTNGIALQDENFVANLLRFFHLPLRRFPGVAYLGCCNATTPNEAVAKTVKKAACFSKACVTRKLPSETAAAATCSEAATTAPMLARETARTAMATGTVLLGKYRSEVEVAVQHALALGLPGAHYVLVGGENKPESRHLPNECNTPTRKARARMGGVLSTSSVEGEASCAQVLLSLPATRQHGFRVLLALLKKRAFRLESDLIEWR